MLTVQCFINKKREKEFMVDVTKRFGAYIREKREEKGISLRDMARQISASPTFVSKVETEDWKPGEEKLRKIAQVIECDEEELIAMAGRVPSELSDIIKQHAHRHELSALLRTTQGMSAEELGKLVEQAKKAKMD